MEEVCRRSARAAARLARASQAGPTVMRLATARAVNCDEAKLRSEEESGRSGQTAGRTHFFQAKNIGLLYLRKLDFFLVVNITVCKTDVPDLQ